jgi:hypothetical protein
MTIDLSQNEFELVLELLDRELRESHSEIRRTETTDYRDELKTQEQLAISLRNRLKKAIADRCY